MTELCRKVWESYAVRERVVYEGMRIICGKRERDVYYLGLLKVRVRGVQRQRENFVFITERVREREYLSVWRKSEFFFTLPHLEVVWVSNLKFYPKRIR